MEFLFIGSLMIARIPNLIRMGQLQMKAEDVHQSIVGADSTVKERRLWKS